MKPRVFVGSSSESLPIAYAIQELLPEMEVTVWSQGIFKLSSNILDDLIRTLDNTDYGVFVFSPDDLVNIRDQQFSAVRDNVVFELGLFVGRLGKLRSYFIIPQGRQDFRLPSDLIGVTPAEFDPGRRDKNLHAALGPAVNKIRSAITSHQPSHEPEPLLTSGLIYLLRHIKAYERSRIFNLHIPKIFSIFNKPSDELPFNQLSEGEQRAWEKVAQYALKYLETHKIINIYRDSSYFIRLTQFGEELLESERAKDLFWSAYEKPLINSEG